jgi:hypothetical protein
VSQTPLSMVYMIVDASDRRAENKIFIAGHLVF